ncbi:MAG: late competence development ComFB family protein [Treponema sp.]|jgi:competence protein ComFB|nr:late competence development ComFB family protein [Treponema sp.]
MDIQKAVHNIMEDIILARVNELCDGITEEQPDICVCPQCRLDTACYALNRVSPRYLVSNRGVARVEQASLEHQQDDADITVLIYEGIRRVNHNQRLHDSQRQKDGANGVESGRAVFNIPTILGRLFNGVNFSPMSDVVVELYRNGELVPMKDLNWQNPYDLVPNIQGMFTFWPAAVPADAEGVRKTFEYTVTIEAPGFESLRHVFNIPVKSEFQKAGTFSMDRTFKLPDLYLFPPEDEQGRRI